MTVGGRPPRCLGRIASFGFAERAAEDPFAEDA